MQCDQDSQLGQRLGQEDSMLPFSQSPPNTVEGVRDCQGLADSDSSALITKLEKSL